MNLTIRGIDEKILATIDQKVAKLNQLKKFKLKRKI